jgi:hypothetical protein
VGSVGKVSADEDKSAYEGTFVFDFYEVLEVVGATVLPLGSLVTVLGRSRDGDGTEWYAVTPDDGETFMVAMKHLRSTGRRLRHEDFYDGSKLRVTLDGHPGGAL